MTDTAKHSAELLGFALMVLGLILLGWAGAALALGAILVAAVNRGSS